jgi:UDP-GlcNAc:undecaprenyl-phosphate GlcNAc-1-phosphate transferase
VIISLLVIFAASCGACLVLTPLARAFGLWVGLLDQPDGHRKIHARPTPVAGGIAVVVSATGAAVAGLALLPVPGGEATRLWGLAVGAALICGVGVLDDLGLLRWRHKLLGQLLAASVVVLSGVVVERFQLFGFRVELGVFAVPFTLFFLLGAINSLNLLDGMDGLLSTVGCVVCVSLAAMAVLGGHGPAAAAAAALAGALLGFLRYNRPPASIFLGDGGSLVVGLVLGTLAVESSLKGPATVVLAGPVALLILPIFDTTAAIIRRTLTGRSILTTDRGHLHHCLLRGGLSVWRVLLLLGAFCALSGLGVFASQAFDNEWVALLTGATVVVVLVATGLFGYAEVVLIRERLRSHVRRWLAAARGEPRQMTVRLQGSGDWQGLWHELTAQVAPLNLQQLRLNINAPALHEAYHASWERSADIGEAGALWRIDVPLSASGMVLGHLEVAGFLDGEPVWEKMAVLARCVGERRLTLSSVSSPGLHDTPLPAPLAGPHPRPQPAATVPVRN